MIYTTILVQLDIDAAATPRLIFAQEIARKFEADLIAVTAAEASTLASPSQSSLAAAEVLRQRTLDIEDRIKNLKEEFLAVLGNERASWRAELDDPTRAVALHARAADLVITGAPATVAAGDFQRTIDPGALILSAGRPVLFAADDLRPLSGEKVLVAWKDCRESRRAVVDAMPFLCDAKEVTVFGAAEEGTLAAREGAADVVRFLIKHGVNAQLQVLVRGESSVGDTIVAKADEIGADLIVAGGYGHSRFREWVFGGATRSLLQSGSSHRLLSIEEPRPLSRARRNHGCVEIFEAEEANAVVTRSKRNFAGWCVLDAVTSQSLTFGISFSTKNGGFAFCINSTAAR